MHNYMHSKECDHPMLAL